MLPASPPTPAQLTSEWLGWMVHAERVSWPDGTLGPRMFMLQPQSVPDRTPRLRREVSLDTPRADGTRMAAWRGAIPDVDEVSSAEGEMHRLEALRRLANTIIGEVKAANPDSDAAVLLAAARARFADADPDVTADETQVFITVSHFADARYGGVDRAELGSAVWKLARTLLRQLAVDNPRWSTALLARVATGRLNQQLEAEQKPPLPKALHLDNRRLKRWGLSPDGARRERVQRANGRVNVRRGVVRELVSGGLGPGGAVSGVVEGGFDDARVGVLAAVAVALRVGRGAGSRMGMWMALIGRRWSWWGCMCWRRVGWRRGGWWCGWWWG